MIIYLIKMTLCASLFLLIYHFLLEKENMHRFKRFFLLASLVISFAIPFIEIEVVADVPVVARQAILMKEYVYGSQDIIERSDVATISMNTAHQPVMINENTLSVGSIVISVYILVCLFLFIRFCLNIFRLMNLAKKHKKLNYNRAQLILLEDKCVAHSFLRYIFISKADFENRNIREEILLHELTHVRQKHSIDIIFIELLSIILWFNPIIYFYKNKIKLNHEFLADETVISNCGDVARYQLILLDEINKNNKLSLASNFNYLITKKRLIMMTKISSKKMKLLKIVGLFPLLAAIVFVFSTVVKANVDRDMSVSEALVETLGIDSIPVNEGKQLENRPFVQRGGDGVSQEKINELNALAKKYEDRDGRWEWEKMDKKDKAIYKEVTDKMSLEQRANLKTLISTVQFVAPYMNGVGVSQAQMDEFQSILKKYRTSNGKYKQIADADGEKLKNIYFLMNSKQQKVQDVIIEKPEKAFSREVPRVKELESWKNAKMYEVWIDGKKTDNAKLSDRKNTDFSHVFISSLMSNGMNRDESKFKINLMTNEGYQEYLEKKKTEKIYIYTRK